MYPEVRKHVLEVIKAVSAITQSPVALWIYAENYFINALSTAIVYVPVSFEIRNIGKVEPGFGISVFAGTADPDYECEPLLACYYIPYSDSEGDIDDSTVYKVVDGRLEKLGKHREVAIRGGCLEDGVERRVSYVGVELWAYDTIKPAWACGVCIEDEKGCADYKWYVKTLLSPSEPRITIVAKRRDSEEYEGKNHVVFDFPLSL
jgi:hypothetical protein